MRSLRIPVRVQAAEDGPCRIYLMRQSNPAKWMDPAGTTIVCFNTKIGPE